MNTIKKSFLRTFTLVVLMFSLIVSGFASPISAASVNKVGDDGTFQIKPNGNAGHPLFPWINGGNGTWKRDAEGNIEVTATVSLGGVWNNFNYKIEGTAHNAGFKGGSKKFFSQSWMKPGLIPSRYNITKTVTFKVAANEYDQTKPISFSLRMFKNTLNIYEGPTTPPTIIPPRVSIGTTATNANDGSKVLPANTEVSIKDTVQYTGLVPGKSYELKGELMDKSTGSPLLVNGQPVTASKTFTPSQASGTEDLIFKFNSSALGGKSVVVFEKLYQDGKEIATHSDINDAGQTVTIDKPANPEIGTTATNAADGSKVVPADKEVSIKDTVSYKNLIPGKAYELKGELMDKATNQPLTVDGKTITASKTFTPTQANGTEELIFTFNSSALYDKSVVVFEKLYQDGKEVAVHTDINDAGQTVTIPPKPLEPEIGTTATNAADGSKVVPADKEVSIKDTVSYKNLIPGKAYELKGELMDKATNQPLTVDGKTITASKTFTPTQANGTEELIFTFNSSALYDKSVVVFEKLYQDGKEVAVHTDINDAGQTVTIPPKPLEPEIGTTATNAADGSKVVPADKEVSIKDTVSYKNLIPGKAYELKGELMDKATNQPLTVDGKTITASKTFTPTQANGTEELIFTFNSSALYDKSVVVFEKLYQDGKEVAVHTDINDAGQTVTIPPKPLEPEIGTTATNAADGSKVVPADKEVSIKDTVSYKNLIPGKAYELKGELMDKATNQPLTVDGKTITASKTFTPTQANGTEELIFTFNSSALYDKSVVVFEKLYQDGKEVAVHTDINDAGQTVTIPPKPLEPEIGTTATNAENGSKEVPEAKEVTIKDTVRYKNLIPGKTYELKGELMDKATNQPLTVDGKTITATKTFTPTQAEGTEDILFTFSSVALGGKSIVVFEKLYQDGKEIAVHTDINDAGQTVTIPPKPLEPEIGTTATNAENGSKEVPEAKEVTIKDTVRYKNLIPGKTYELKGELMDKATNKPLMVDGKTITATKTFTPTQAEGTEDILFTFSSVALGGKSIVVFEKLYQDGKEIAVHTDINDAGQTVTIPPKPLEPEIGTTATNAENGSKEVPEAKEVTIKDTVDYKNLIPGKTYELKGVLMDKATNQPLLVDGKPITATKLFTPTQANGREELIFTFSSVALGGKSIVVFEKLYQDGKEVAVHTDINDKSQTVTVPPKPIEPIIKTTASNVKDGSKEIAPEQKVTIRDIVKYENLIPGKTYELKGILMDKSTGKPLMINGQTITATKTFVPKTPNGSEEVLFTLDASDLAGKKVVVFETLYQDGIEVVVHADINDADQTVVFVRPPLPPTGLSSDYTALLFSGVLVALGLGSVVAGRRKKEQEQN